MLSVHWELVTFKRWQRPHSANKQKVWYCTIKRSTFIFGLHFWFLDTSVSKTLVISWVVGARGVSFIIHSKPLSTLLGWTSLIPQLVKNPPAMQETLVRFLIGEICWRRVKATHSSILAWRIPWDRKELDTTERLSLFNLTRVYANEVTWGCCEKDGQCFCLGADCHRNLPCDLRVGTFWNSFPNPWGWEMSWRLS